MTVSLPGLGPDDLVPVLNRKLDLATAGLTPEEYFVLTRVDGRTSLRQLILISGIPEPRAVAVLARLHETAAILWPGEEPGPRPPPPAPPPPVIKIADDDPQLAEDVELTVEQKRLIIEKHRALRDADYFHVLGVERDADRRALKNAYRQLSKHFHPDRYFGKRLGSYKEMLTDIFDQASSALEVLADPERRELYLAALAAPATPPRGVARPPTSPPLGTPVVRRRADEIFEVSCARQLAGDLRGALEGLAAAIAIESHPRFLRRAADVALQAQELRLAEEYAKKATELDPDHASAHRIHAKVLQAKGRRREARAALENARRLEPDNPHIAAELRELGHE